jgi:Glycosyltransferase WbsX
VTKGKRGGAVNRRDFIAGVGALAASTQLSRRLESKEPRDKEGSCRVAAYYFANYHLDERNIKAHGPGWTEWNLVKAAAPRFPGHRQPRIPLWGYEDESDPKVFEKKIAIASLSNIDAFIFDWYWYKDGPFLEAALTEGYLRASNCRDLKFGVMWANHDWFDIQPAKIAGEPTLQFAGAIGAQPFEAMVDRLLVLFQHPSYLLVDGCPYFSIYELFRFVQGFGGVAGAALALEKMRGKVRALGFPDIHLNAVTWGVKLLPGQSEVTDLPELLDRLHVDSATSYVWIHHTQFAKEFTTEYGDIRNQYEIYRMTAAKILGRPYFPNVTVGWDSTPRACQTDNYRLGGYPFTSVIVNNTPEVFRAALESARDFAAANLPPTKRIITLNSWNEWTEGSYLEPDTVNGMSYLDGVRAVFNRT